jgi:type I restriction enzyme S subunit
MARALFKESLGQDSNEHRLDDLCEIFDGPHATPKTVAQGPIFLGISNISDGLLDLSNTRHLTEDDFCRWTKRVTPCSGDVVFSYETRLGQAARIPKGLRCCLGRRMGLLRAKKEKISPATLLYCYLSPTFQETIRSRTIHGSTVNRIPLIEMGGFPIVVSRLECRETGCSHS